MTKITIKQIQALKPKIGQPLTKISLHDSLLIYVRKSGRKSVIQEYTYQGKKGQCCLGDQANRVAQVLNSIVLFSKARGCCITQFKQEVFDVLSESEYLARRPLKTQFAALTKFIAIAEFFSDCRNYSYFFQKNIKTLSRTKNADLFQYNN